MGSRNLQSSLLGFLLALGVVLSFFLLQLSAQLRLLRGQSLHLVEKPLGASVCRMVRVVQNPVGRITEAKSENVGIHLTDLALQLALHPWSLGAVLGLHPA